MIPISDSIATHRFPLLNIFLISFTIFVFVLQLMIPNQEEFIYQYALVPANVNLSDLTTLLPFITSMFLHGGILHIASNMLFLWVFGDNIEAHFGWAFFVPIYLISGIIGGLVQYALMSDSPIPMLGASGAVAGVLGAYFVLFPHSTIKTLVPFFGFLTVVRIPAAFMLGYWFVLQLISGATSFPFSEGGGVAFWAHVGGFVTGIIFARFLKKKEVLNTL